MTIRDLAAELMLNRPSEPSLAVHIVGMAKVQGGYLGHCSCGDFDRFEAGHLESSKAFIEAQMHDHKAGVK